MEFIGLGFVFLGIACECLEFVSHGYCFLFFLALPPWHMVYIGLRISIQSIPSIPTQDYVELTAHGHDTVRPVIQNDSASGTLDSLFRLGRVPVVL